VKLSGLLFPAFKNNHPVETKLFEITLVVTIAMMYFLTFFGFYFGYLWPSLTVYSAACILYTSFYLVYLKYSISRPLIISYYTTAFVLITLAWLPSGGLMGSIITILVLLFISGLLVLRLVDFKKFIIVSFTIVIGFTIYEVINPNAAARFDDYQAWMIHTAVYNIIMLVVLGFTLLFYKKEYKRDREKLTESNYYLEKEKIKAEAADKAKAKFLTHISHEVRTPLNGILGNLEILQNTNLDEEQLQIIKDLNHSSDMLHGLISDLLDVAMIDESGMLMQETEVDLQNVITGVVQFFIPKVAMKAHNVSINFKHDQRIPNNLTGDLTRIRQVLINLVNNAVKFTEQGAVTVRTELLAIHEHMVEVKVSISDTGVGVSEDLLETIFDTFQRTVNAEANGMGLGLSVCKKIIDAMGGEIGVENTSSEGSTFYFKVPFQWKGNSALSKSRHLKGRANPYSSLAVLVAEDQEINQVVIKKMLHNLGITDISIAEDGQRVVEMALSRSYDFILMDLRMPRKNGIQATMEILDLLKSHPPIILALTANATKFEMDSCFNVGMKDFISKPISLEVLRSSIGKHVIR